jgi:DNA-binding CsgD family transcriptional regulator
VLEDVHWADEATLDVLTLLAARIGSAPALALASYRDDELDRAPQLRFVLGEVVRRTGRLAIAPLWPAAVAELAGPHGVDPGELHRRTGGNSFSLSRRWRQAARESRPQCATRCWPAPRRCRRPRGGCSRPSRSCPGRPSCGCSRHSPATTARRSTRHWRPASSRRAARTSASATSWRARRSRRRRRPRRLALHRAALAALVARDADPARLAQHGLTARELEVLALLAEGLRNAQIAERLVLSEKTVGHHVSAVLRKLGVSTRGEATAAAVRLGVTARDSAAD